MRAVFYCICAYAVKSRFMKAQGDSDNECVISEIVKGYKTKEVISWQIWTPITNIKLKNICYVGWKDNEYI